MGSKRAYGGESSRRAVPPMGRSLDVERSIGGKLGGGPTQSCPDEAKEPDLAGAVSGRKTRLMGQPVWGARSAGSRESGPASPR